MSAYVIQQHTFTLFDNERIDKFSLLVFTVSFIIFVEQSKHNKTPYI